MALSQAIGLVRVIDRINFDMVAVLFYECLRANTEWPEC